MRNAALALLLIPALAACGTPQERCIDGQTRDLRVLTGLIAESEASIARGYGYEEQLVRRMEYVQCNRWRRVRDNQGRIVTVPSTSFCWEPYTDTVKKPVAIDIEAEKRKLAEMKVKQAELRKRADAGILACRQQFPG